LKAEPIAVLCSDIHLSLKQPPCRADDWLSVQKGYLVQLKSLACAAKELWLGNRNTTGRPIPILCAGDIFDKWNSPPELIRFALEHLPDGMICVPGQHDLPNHSFEEIHRSAYGVLREAGKIRCAATQPAPTLILARVAGRSMALGGTRKSSSLGRKARTWPWSTNTSGPSRPPTAPAPPRHPTSTSS
jgi:hypothetical protein